MDDGGIVGPTDLLLKVWDILKNEGPPLGLHLNPTKCEWSWLNADCDLPCPLEHVQLVPTSEIQMLGVPLGSDGFVSDYVEGKLLTNSVKVMSKLAEFEDSQAAMYLLRLSYGIVRANHFMRTTPLPQWRDVAAKFDDCVRDAVCKILGTPLPDSSYDQACISTKVGGLGIRRVVDHAIGALRASWHESSRTCGESWTAPAPLAEGDEYVPQSEFSADVDRKTLERLIDEGKERDAQRLRRLDMPHANVWTSLFKMAKCISRVFGAFSVYCYLYSCPLSSLQANHGCLWRAFCCKKSGI